MEKVRLNFAIKYLLNTLYPELGNKNLPWVDQLVLVMHQLLDPDQKVAEEAFPKLLTLRQEYPNVNEINYLIGRIYELRSKPQYLVAAPYYQGCSSDYSPALGALSYFYATGEHGETNHELSLKLIKEAVFKDDKIRDDVFPVALFNYGLGLYDGKMHGQIKVETDKKQGFDLMLKAADLGYSIAQMFVGNILCKEGSKENFARGIHYLQLAARQDNPQAAVLFLNFVRNEDCLKFLLEISDYSNKSEFEKEKFLEDNFKNMAPSFVPLIEAYDIAEKLYSQYPEIMKVLKPLLEKKEVKGLIDFLRDQFNSFKARIFQIKDIKERNEAITKLAEWGDRDCQHILGLMYEGINPGMMLMDTTKSKVVGPECGAFTTFSGARPIEVTLNHKKDKKKAIAHYEHFVEREQTLVPAFQLAFFLEYGLGKTKNPRLRDITMLFSEGNLSEIFTEEELYPTKEVASTPPGGLSLEETKVDPKKEDVIEMAQLKGNLLKAFDYYRKAARAFSPDYRFSSFETQMGLLCKDIFGIDDPVNYDYFFLKFKKLAHVYQVRREVAKALDSCGIKLQLSGKKTDPVDLIANYHGIEGYQVKTNGSRESRRGKEWTKHC